MNTNKHLLFINSMYGGGAERIMLILAQSLADAGKEVWLVTRKGEETDFYKADSRIHRISLSSGLVHGKLKAWIRVFADVWALRTIIKKHAIGNVFAMMPIESIISIVATAGLSSRLIVAERNYPPAEPFGRVWHFLRKHLYKYPELVAVQTQGIANWVLEHTRAKRVEIIPNPVSYPLSPNSPVVPPADYIVQGQQFFLAVGSKARQKGFDMLVEAFSTSAPHHQWNLVILGLDSNSGEDARQVELQIEEANQKLGKQRILAIKRAGNVGDWYACADAFVLSSRYEGFPNVLLEAMSYGLPVISFRCMTGPEDMITDGESGLLVEFENVPLLADGMVRLAQDVDFRKRLGSNATEVRQRFSREFILAKWLDLLIVK